MPHPDRLASSAGHGWGRWGVGFESHVHYERETLFTKKREFAHVKNLNTIFELDLQKLGARVGQTRPPVCMPFALQGGRALKGLDWVGDRLTFYQVARRTKKSFRT